MRSALILTAMAVVLSGLAIPPAAAADPVLSVAIGGPASRSVKLDLAALSALPVATIRTATPWHSEQRTYEGVPLKALLDHLQVTQATVRATAINDYAIDIPVEDAERYGVLVAYRINGKLISVREKGPFFVMYPFDERPELKREMYYSRCIWQLDRIELR